MSENVGAPEEEALSPQQIRAVAMLCAGKPRKSIAKDLDVTTRTLERWLTQDAFKLEIHKIRLAMKEEVVGQLLDAASTAAQTVRDLMIDCETPANVRLSAAIKILSLVGVEESMTVSMASKGTGDLTPEHLAKVRYQIYGLGPPPPPANDNANGNGIN